MGPNEPRHRRYGTAMGEWVVMRANELDIHAVGFWQIVPVGREGFGLEGPDLDAFVRRSLVELFSRGAVPVHHIPENRMVWTQLQDLGGSPDEVADAIIAEWIAGGRLDPDLGGLWFTTKDELDRPFCHDLVRPGWNVDSHREYIAGCRRV